MLWFFIARRQECTIVRTLSNAISKSVACNLLQHNNLWLKIFQMVSLSTHGDLFNCSIKRPYSTTTPNYTFSDSVCLTIIFFGADRGISPFCTLSLPAEHLQFLSCSLSCPVLLRTPAGTCAIVSYIHPTHIGSWFLDSLGIYEPQHHTIELLQELHLN